MNVMPYLEKLTERQRLLLLLVAVLLAAAVALLLARTPEKTAIPSVSAKKDSQVSFMPIKTSLPTGKIAAAAGNELRDPFAVPAEFSGQKEQMVSVSSVASQKDFSRVPKKSTAASIKGKFKLTGIIAAAEQRLAVIKLGKKGKAYQLGEFIGDYQLTVINEASVVLTGRDQDLVLRLEISQERGTASEK